LGVGRNGTLEAVWLDFLKQILRKNYSSAKTHIDSNGKQTTLHHLHWELLKKHSSIRLFNLHQITVELIIIASHLALSPKSRIITPPKNYMPSRPLGLGFGFGFGFDFVP
jgi:hypothetical protein